METKQQKSRFHSMQSKSFIAALVVAALVFFVSVPLMAATSQKLFSTPEDAEGAC
jgi:uncharacterized membrane protein (DUF485 family)